MSDNLDYLVTWKTADGASGDVTERIYTLEDLLGYVSEPGDSVTVSVIIKQRSLSE